MSINIFSGSRFSKSILFNFDNRSSASCPVVSYIFWLQLITHGATDETTSHEAVEANYNRQPGRNFRVDSPLACLSWFLYELSRCSAPPFLFPLYSLSSAIPLHRNTRKEWSVSKRVIGSIQMRVPSLHTHGGMHALCGAPHRPFFTRQCERCAALVRYGGMTSMRMLFTI